jgi:hypothetical protein
MPSETPRLQHRRGGRMVAAPAPREEVTPQPEGRRRRSHRRATAPPAIPPRLRRMTPTTPPANERHGDLPGPSRRPFSSRRSPAPIRLRSPERTLIDLTTPTPSPIPSVQPPPYATQGARSMMWPQALGNPHNMPSNRANSGTPSLTHAPSLLQVVMLVNSRGYVTSIGTAHVPATSILRHSDGVVVLRQAGL